MKVCVIDDDDKKRKEIADILKDRCPEPVQIVEGGSINAARRHLKAESFDLLIIDIALPNFDREEPELYAGMKLLEEIVRGSHYRVPNHIIGITAHDEVFSDASASFGGELWSILRYDSRSDEWVEQLRSKILHIYRVRNNRSEEESDFDLGIVVALRSPEHEAVRALPWGWEKISAPNDPSQYLEGEYTKADGSTGKAILVRSAAMGMPSAAIVATKLHLLFRPRVLAMVGICAGVRGETDLGDVVVANPTWDYGCGKYSTNEDGSEKFEPSNYHYALSSRIRGLVEAIEGECPELAEIRSSYVGDKPNTVTKLHIGPFASGAAVIARSAIMDWIKEQNRKLIAVDMEAHAIACAAHEMPAPTPEYLVLKGVSDFADEMKGDSERRYAAYASASVLRYLAERSGL